LRGFLLAILLGFLAGGLEKAMALSIAAGIESARQVLQGIQPLATTPGVTIDIDITTVIEAFAEPLVWPLTWWARRAARAGGADPLCGQKLLVRFYLMQSAAAFMQLLCAAGGVGAILLGVSA
jgi:hypothetical protein